MFAKSTLLLLAPLAATVLANSSYTWQAPSSTDRRSPCPMVNTLANHGYLPHDGLNVSLADLITAFSEAVNLDPAATALVGGKALATSTTGNNLTFNLDDLDTHDILEHDGSLSRADVYFGDNHSFNETIYNTTYAYFGGDVITTKQAAAARAGRFVADALENPVFALSDALKTFSLIESALYLSVFSNGSSDTAVTEWVDVMFRQERLPLEEGFAKPESIILAAEVLAKVAVLAMDSIGL